MKKTLDRRQYELLAMVAVLYRRFFLASKQGQLKAVKIKRFLCFTPGGRHAWCESNYGLVRKPVGSMPKGATKRRNFIII